MVNKPVTTWRLTSAIRVSAPGWSVDGCNTACTLTPGTLWASSRARSSAAEVIGRISVSRFRKRSTWVPAGPMLPDSFTAAIRPSVTRKRKVPCTPRLAETAVST